MWRDTACESHFIVWKDKIYLFGAVRNDEGDDRDELWPDDVTISRELVLDAISSASLESLAAIADRLDALPWDILIVCRRLVAEGAAVEGTGVQRAHFRRN